MGVTGLWKLIEPSGKPVPLETLENKILAIDISIWLHQVVKGFQDSEGSTLPNAHLLGLFHRLCKLLFYKIRPVFVFDGKCPALKLQTIRKRAQNTSKLHNEADRIQQLLLATLAKEKIVKQALGDNAKLLISPVKRRKDDVQEDMFKLPPIQEKSSDTEAIEVDEEDESEDEYSSRQYFNHIQSLDINSSHFKNLPSDVKHEILTDIKETRKQNSWGRLHELPVQSDDFSSFQMKKLIKRRQVQVSLEETQKEMGGKSMSLAELEALLTEEGIVAAKSSGTDKHIASDEVTRFLHVRSVQKAIEKAKNDALLEPTPPKIMKIVEEDPQEGTSSNFNENNKKHDELDLDLQKAIEMSLMENGCELTEVPESLPVKMSDEQKKELSNAMTLARGYMIEYGGMSSENVVDLLEKSKDETNLDGTFKYNDKSIFMDDKNITEEDNHRSPNYVSSEADSDFIDVPEDLDPEEVFGSVNVSNNKANGDLKKDFRLEDLKLKCSPILEIVVKPEEIKIDEDDIFADIFVDLTEKENPEDEVEIVQDLELTVDLTASGTEKVEVLEFSVDLTVSGTEKVKASEDTVDLTGSGAEKVDVSEDSVDITGSGAETEVEVLEIKTESETKSILEKLQKEREEISKLTLDCIEIEDSDEECGIITELSEIQKTPKKSSVISSYFQSKSPSSIQKTPTKPDEIEEIVPKVKSPFFVRRTPKSKRKLDEMEDGSSQTNTKVVKTLFTEVIKSPLKPEEMINEAASSLKETKTTAELKDMAEILAAESRNLQAERNKNDRMGVSISEQMNSDCMKLLKLFGIPFICAPMEAEAQCAFLNYMKLTDGTITDDSDIWLFGGRTVYKNFFNQKKHVMEFQIENIESLFNVDRSKMIQLAMLVGSDYTTGVNGVGTVTALEILAAFRSTPEESGQSSMISGLEKFKEWVANGKTVGPNGRTVLRSKLKNIDITEGFPSKDIADAYLHPIVDESDDKFTWGHPDSETIREFTKRNFGWTKTKTDEILLPVLKKLDEKKSQQSIKNYFQRESVVSTTELAVSKRVKNAINKMSGSYKSDDENELKAKKSKKGKILRKKDKNIDEASTSSSSSATATEISSKINAASTQSLSKSDEPKSNVKNKSVRIPNTNQKIPQREKSEEERQNNKLKAIEMFKKSKDFKK